MKDFLKKIFYMGVDLSAQTVDVIEKTIDELVKKGEISEKEGKKIVKKILKKSEVKKDYLEFKIKKVLKEVLPSNKKKGIKNLLSEEEMLEDLKIKAK